MTGSRILAVSAMMVLFFMDFDLLLIILGLRNRTIPQKGAEVEHNRQTALLLQGCYLPAEVPFIPDAGVQREAVVAGGGGVAGVRLGDLLHAGDGIGSGAQLGGEGDGIAGVQLMNVAKIAVCSSIVVE